MVDFTKESLDLVLDKRDEMIKLAEIHGVPIHRAFSSFITCVSNEKELMEIAEVLGVEEFEKVIWDKDEDYLYEIRFEYRGHKFYHLEDRKQV